MPELPEVETVRRSLLPHLIGRRIVGATLRRRDICESHGAAGRRTPTDGRRLLEGALITEIRRHGKQLALIAKDGRIACVHLGMTGQLLWRTGGSPREQTRHEHLAWDVAGRGGRVLGHIVFRDPRRFGGVWTFESLEQLRSVRWRNLGPDSLTLTSAQLRAGLRDTHRPIKAALLDQRVVAGVGNIYADEALFEARVRPRRLANRLNDSEIDALAAAIRAVLTAALGSGGSTLRDYVDANGDTGRAQLVHQVYGRGGDACLRCGSELRMGIVGQRTTVWCTQCQQ